MKNVTTAFKTAQDQPMSKIVRRISYKRRYWDGSNYIWEASWTVLPESSIVQVGTITAKLDTDRLNEFKISNVDIAVLNSDDSWNPWGGSIFYQKEAFWTKFKIESGYILADTSIEYIPIFVGVVIGFSLEAGGQTVRFNVQGLEAILMNSNAESVSVTVANETPSGTINGTNKDFVTLNPGVGLIDNVQVNSVDNKPGKNYDISQLNEPTLGAKITFKVAPPSGQTVKVWYRYWKQDQKFENLITDLLTVAGLQSGASIQQVTFPGGVSDSYTFDSQSDWSNGTSGSTDVSRFPGDLRLLFGAPYVTFGQIFDLFSDGNYTSNPVWTTAGQYAAFSVATHPITGSNALRIFKDAYECVADAPSNGAKVGEWEFEITNKIVSAAGSSIQLAFSPTTFQYNTASPYGPVGYNGDFVLIEKTYPSGNWFVRLYINNSLVSSYDAGTTYFGISNVVYVKVVRTPNTAKVYIDNILRCSATSTSFNTPSKIGIGLGKTLDVTDCDWYVDSIFQPQATITGQWTSQILDLSASVTAFGTLIIDKYLGSGSITISTATSADAGTWDSWVAVSGDGTINSTLRRYIKIKIDMTMPSNTIDEPYISYMKLNYTKITTTIKLANFTDKTCYDAIQAIGAFSNYEWGFKEDETFFFREKDVSKTVDQILDYSKNLTSFEVTNSGHDRVYSEVQATFGNYDIVVGDTGGQYGPLKRFGRKRLTVDGGDLLINPDTDVATGIATGMYDTMKEVWRIFNARAKLMQWIDLSDTVSVIWGNEFLNLLYKVIGVRHNIEDMTTELDLQEIPGPDLIVSIPNVNIDIIGQPPAIITGSTIVVPLTTVSVSTNAPTISTGASVQVPVTSINLTTNTPSVVVAPFSNYGFEPGLTGWTQEGYTWDISSTAYEGGQSAYWVRSVTDEWWGSGGTGVVYCEIRDADGYALDNFSLGGGLTVDTWVEKTIPLSGYSTQVIRIAIGDDDGTMLMSPAFTSSGQDIKFFARAHSAGANYSNYIDFFHI